MSEQIYTNKVSIVHFHIFMSFYSIYAILLRIRFCRDLRFFCVNFWGQKLRLRKFFDKYDVCRSEKVLWALKYQNSKSNLGFPIMEMEWVNCEGFT